MSFLRSLALATFGLLLLATPVWAAPRDDVTITFFDGTDSVSSTGVEAGAGSRVNNTGACVTTSSFEQCSVSVLAPAGAIDFLISGLTFNNNEVLIVEAVGVGGSALVSDVLRLDGRPPAIGFGFDITFFSDADGVHLLPIVNGPQSPTDCDVSSGSCIAENGHVQLAATIVWCSTNRQNCIPPGPNSPGVNVVAVDTFLFCSDVEGVSSTCSTGGNSVPEPATLLLLGSGLAGLAGVTWRRHRRK